MRWTATATAGVWVAAVEGSSPGLPDRRAARMYPAQERDEDGQGDGDVQPGEQRADPPRGVVQKGEGRGVGEREGLTVGHVNDEAVVNRPTTAPVQRRGNAVDPYRRPSARTRVDRPPNRAGYRAQSPDPLLTAEVVSFGLI